MEESKERKNKSLEKCMKYESKKKWEPLKLKKHKKYADKKTTPLFFDPFEFD